MGLCFDLVPGVMRFFIFSVCVCVCVRVPALLPFLFGFQPSRAAHRTPARPSRERGRGAGGGQLQIRSFSSTASFSVGGSLR